MMFLKAIMVAGALVSYVSGQTVYLAGDSTMAAKGGGSGTEGWGQYLRYSLELPVVNNAMGGRSARSFTREGRFDTINSQLKSGDFVIIEFGHNDGSSKPDNGRSDCPGEGAEVCIYNYNGATETVYTFPAYIEAAATKFKAKGAHVIVSSQTPNNPDETGVFVDGASRFVALAAKAAETANVDYVDHSAYSLAAYKPLPVAEVNSYFPNDHTHTAPEAADLVSKAFVRGLVCGNSLLKSHVINGTNSIPGECL